jgi:hypothetical protein
LAIYGADGAPTFLQELLGWDYGRMLEKVGRHVQGTLVLQWGMGPGLAFGTFCGNMTLKAAFPALFGIAAAKDAFVPNKT